MEHMPRAAARRNSEATERKFSLPLGYRVTFCWQPGEHFQLRWCPDVPLIRKARARRKFFEAYQAARRSFLEEVAAVIRRRRLNPRHPVRRRSSARKLSPDDTALRLLVMTRLNLEGHNGRVV
jgi:hypothetical protein